MEKQVWSYDILRQGQNLEVRQKLLFRRSILLCYKIMRHHINTSDCRHSSRFSMFSAILEQWSLTREITSFESMPYPRKRSAFVNSIAKILTFLDLTTIYHVQKWIIYVNCECLLDLIWLDRETKASRWYLLISIVLVIFVINGFKKALFGLAGQCFQELC